MLVINLIKEKKKKIKKKKKNEKRLNLKRYLKKKGRNNLVFDGKMKTKISQK